ncbi:uncharacterized protein TNIN_151311 [Trichonephila inaurata madagascariensis]|uniref:Uncharacterized protein n=1 Tax=Trichonephila inaurata madagascariensis TaxID=2747483 RepID=A0A8X7BN80_9ARAC|nr:uncharacterized protein TNIN_151311 [Trichonephila inaurata madagascariensis]
MNRTHTSFLVLCEAGYDGGAPQRFYFRAKLKGSRDDGLSLSSPMPIFNLSGLPSGSTFDVSVYARNKIGKSLAVILETTTLRTKRKGGTWTWKTNRSLLISSMLILCFAILTLGAAAILRHRSHPFLL